MGIQGKKAACDGGPRGKVNPLFRLAMNIRKIGLVILIFMIPFVLTAGCEKGTEPEQTPVYNLKDFPVFDTMLHEDKPETSALGLVPMRIVYAGSMWPQNDPREEPHEATIRSVANTLPKLNSPVIIDIEHWHVRNEPDSVIRKNIAKYEQVVDIFRDERPELFFGYYSLIPIRDYWAPVGGDAERIAEWQEANANLTGLAEHVDAVFPSLYTFYEDREGWKTYAQANIEEARKYGKPVYPFLWFEYHDSNQELKGTQIPADYWRMQLDLCRELADGIVIWGGWQRVWNENAAWWLETKKFLRTL